MALVLVLSVALPACDQDEPGAAPAGSVETDREALVALYSATDGPNWANNENWLSNAPIGEWAGVSTNNSGRVDTLDLRENGLAGEIPPELGNLSRLARIVLFDNDRLTGCIPAALRDHEIRSTRAFCVTAADLTFPIGSHEGDWEALVALYNATDGPNWRHNYNWLSDRPIGDWAGVNAFETGRVFSLSLLSFGLSGPIPPELGNLSSLQRLAIKENRLSGEIPPELGRLANLKWLDLSHNQLSGEIPPELGNLSNLVDMNLAFNQLRGSIPPELGNLTGLELNLNLGNNRLSGEMPPELGSLSKLRSLQLRSNQLSGEIPAELSNLSSLEGLHLINNRLSGEIPPELGSLANLKWLDLGNNLLTGSIPGELGNLSALEGLTLEGNDLSGVIPPELWDMTGTDFWLRGNQDSWCVPEAQRAAIRGDYVIIDLPFCGATATPYPTLTPAEIMDREALVALYNATGGDNWYRNQNWLSDLPLFTWEGVETDGEGRVTALRLSENNLTREIPPELGSLSNLALLALWANWLSGEIPPELGNLTNLRIVYLPENQLTGCIPGSLLSQLNIENSTLGGLPFCGAVPYPTPIRGTPTPAPAASPTPTVRPTSAPTPYPTLTPDAIMDREALVALYNATGGDNWRRNDNWLSDLPLFTWEGVGTDDEGRVGTLYLRDNRLSGDIPSELGNLENLVLLDLAQNQLSGEIPSDLGGLTNLTSLDLFWNNLSGEIPPELGSLSNLEWLDLSRNELSGAIPSELGNLTTLKVLALNYNDLSGDIPPELGNLSNLKRLRIDGAWTLSGCLPAALQSQLDMERSELQDLSFCGVASTLAPTRGAATPAPTATLSRAI